MTVISLGRKEDDRWTSGLVTVPRYNMRVIAVAQTWKTYNTTVQRMRRWQIVENNYNRPLAWPRSLIHTYFRVAHCRVRLVSAAYTPGADWDGRTGGETSAMVDSTETERSILWRDSLRSKNVTAEQRAISAKCMKSPFSRKFSVKCRLHDCLHVCHWSASHTPPSNTGGTDTRKITHRVIDSRQLEYRPRSYNSALHATIAATATGHGAKNVADGRGRIIVVPVRESRASAVALASSVLRLSHRGRRTQCVMSKLRRRDGVLANDDNNDYNVPSRSYFGRRVQRLAYVRDWASERFFFLPFVDRFSFRAHIHPPAHLHAHTRSCVPHNNSYRLYAIIVALYTRYGLTIRGRNEKEKIEKKKQLRAPRNHHPVIVPPPLTIVGALRVIYV